MVDFLSLLCVCVCVCVALCHPHPSVSQLKIWGYNELYTKCLYIDTKIKENTLNYFQMLFVLNFFIINTVYNYILIFRTTFF